MNEELEELRNSPDISSEIKNQISEVIKRYGWLPTNRPMECALYALAFAAKHEGLTAAQEIYNS